MAELRLPAGAVLLAHRLDSWRLADLARRVAGGCENAPTHLVLFNRSSYDSPSWKRQT